MGRRWPCARGLNERDQLILNPPIGLVDGMRVTTTSEARWIAGTQPAAGYLTLMMPAEAVAGGTPVR
jgi:hypothetical protein